MSFMQIMQESKEEHELFAKLVSSADMIGELANHVARLAELKKGVSAEYMDEMQYHLEWVYKYYKAMESKEPIEGHIQKMKGNIYILEENNVELHDMDVLEVYIERYSSGKGCIVKNWHLTRLFKPAYGAAYFYGYSEVPVEGVLARLKRPSWENRQKNAHEEVQQEQMNT